LIYCAEGIDNRGRALDIELPDDVELKADFRPDLLGGIVTLAGNACKMEKIDHQVQKRGSKPLQAIPYYAWSNRGPGEMAVYVVSKNGTNVALN